METETILAVLFSWASHLSGYPAPAHPPPVQFVSHAYFVEHACGGRECNVVGWYNDQDIVYIDERFREGLETGFAASLVVHEFTHYLQHKSGNFRSHSCEDSVEREREAYYVQNEYFVQALARVGSVRPAHRTCKYEYTTAEEPLDADRILSSNTQ